MSDFLTSITPYADELNKLGLFMGTVSGATPPVYELDGQLTRIQALILVIRLMGLEEEALSGSGKNNLLDVPSWAVKYAVYAYQNGITTGVNAEGTLFAPNRAVTCQEFTTFLLRSLGYRESRNDFQYATALNKALEIGLYTEDVLAELNSGTFLRGDAVVVMVNALLTPIKDSNDTLLIDTLVNAGLFSSDTANEFVAAIARADERGF